MVQASVLDAAAQLGGPHGGACRPPAMGTRGVVASAHGLASTAGLRCLMAGGNAVDAAVAVAATLAVVEPFMSGLGGYGGFMLIHHAASQRLYGLDFNGATPRAADPSLWSDQEELTRDPRAIGVPAAVAGWLAAHERFGRLRREAVLQPAIEQAEAGWPVSTFAASELADQADKLALFETSRQEFLADGQVPAVGQVLPRQRLAASLRQLADGGAEGYYRGELGERIVRGVQQAGGLLTRDDLAEVAVDWVEPIGVDYRGVRAWTLPRESNGVQYLQSMAILEPFDLVGLGHNTADYLHLLLETIKLASADRTRYVMDPSVPLELLLDREYLAGRRSLIDPRRAAPSEGERFRALKDGLVPSGDPLRYRQDNTTHFETADAEGNLVACTQTNGSVFGCGLVAGDTGIVMNNALYFRDLDPASPNVIRAGRKGSSSMSPCVVTRAGQPLLGIGTPGSYGILQTTLQMLLNQLDFGLNVQAAIEAPRVRAFERTRVDLEARISPETRAGLAERGHELTVLDNWSWKVGGGHGVSLDRPRGVLTAGADPRRDGVALAW